MLVKNGMTPGKHLLFDRKAVEGTAKALHKLRHPSRSKKLRDFLE